MIKIMKKDEYYLKTVAVFMITLIVMIPMYVSVAYADVNFNYLGGTAGVDGYRSGTDATIINATSTLSGFLSVIEAPGVYINCSISNISLYSCVFDSGEFETGEASYSYSLKEVDTNHNSMPGAVAVTKPLKIDATVPTVSLTGVSQSKTVTETNNGTNSTTDFYAIINFTASDPKDGAGLYVIEFYMDAQLVATNNFSGKVNDFSGGVSFKTTSSGTKTFYAKAVDRVYNYYDSAPQNFSLDFEAPNVDSTFSIMLGDKEVKYISQIPGYSGGMPSNKLLFNIKDAHLNSNDVKVDISELNIHPIYKSIYQTPVTASCDSSENETWACIVDKDSQGNTLRLLPNATPVHITVTASDSQGNEVVTKLSNSFTIDNTRPNATFLGTDHCVDSKCYMKEGSSNFVLSISNTGAAFDQNFVSLDLASVTSASTTQIRANCSGTSSVSCVVNNVSILSSLSSGTSYAIYNVDPSMDDAGNKITFIESEVFYDGDGPVIEYIDFNNSATGADYIVSGDEVLITASVVDYVSGFNKVWADLSTAVNGSTEVAGSCSENTDKNSSYYTYYSCTWVTPPVTDGYTKAELVFHLEDNAGNIVNQTETMIIYALSDDAKSLWKVSSISLNPPYYDADVMQYMPSTYTEWASVNLASNQGDTTILNMEFDTCVPGVDSSAISSAKLYRAQRTKAERIVDSGTVIIAAELGNIVDNTTNTTASTIDYSCTLLITSLSSTTVYPTEILNVSISVPVTSTGFDVGADYDAKLAELRKELEDGKLLDDIAKYLQIIINLCQTYHDVLTVWNGASAVIKAATLLLSGPPYGEYLAAVTTELKTGDNVITAGLGETADDIISWGCALAECTVWEKTGWYDDDNWFASFMRIYIASLNGQVGWETDSSWAKYASMGVGKANDPLKGSMLELSKKSIYISIIALCVPGVIYNLEKARAIDCQYYLCLKDDVADGENPYRCQVSRAYTYCLYVFGNIFYLIPFSGLLEKIGEMIELFSSDIMSAIGFGFGVTCYLFTLPPASTNGVYYVGCGTLELIKLAKSVVSTFTNYLDKWDSDAKWSGTCERALA